jgi:hypothetical protein
MPAKLGSYVIHSYSLKGMPDVAGESAACTPANPLEKPLCLLA